jgi:hypothetical protein
MSGERAAQGELLPLWSHGPYAVRALKAHWIGPDEGYAHTVSVKLEIDRLLRLRAPTNEIVHRVAPKKRPQSFKYFAIKPNQFAPQCGSISKS